MYVLKETMELASTSVTLNQMLDYDFEFKVCVMKHMKNTIFPIKIIFKKPDLKFQGHWLPLSG